MKCLFGFRNNWLGICVIFIYLFVLKPYLYFFTVLSDLEFNIAAGSLVLNSFKRVSQISFIPFHLPIENKDNTVKKYKYGFKALVELV
jgi:hypothetical protein